MTNLWLPGAGACRPHTPRADLIAHELRNRHVDRLTGLAMDILDEAAEATLSGNPKRAHYLEQWWAPRVERLAEQVSAEPLARILGGRS